MMKGVFLLVALLIGSVGSGWAQGRSGSSFAGVFSNGSITLTLEENASGYSGRVQIDAAIFPVAAQVQQGGHLKGTYTYQGQPIPFQAQLQGTALTIIDGDGSSYVLHRQDATAGDRETRGEAYPAAGADGREMRDPGWGIRFTLPAEWTGHAGGGGFILGSNTLKGFILVTPLEATTLDAVRAEARQGIVDDQGTRLVLNGAVEPFGEHGLAGDFAGTIEGQPARARIVGLISPHGSGATILGAVESASYTPQHAQAVEAVARSVRFSAPEITPLAGQWKARFAGKRLTYMESYYSSGGGGYGGYSDKKVYDLCPDGTFAGEENFNLSVDTGGAFGSARNNPGQMRGRWQVKTQGNQAFLEMTSPDGSVVRFRLEDQNGQTYLDGQRWYVTNDATSCY